MNINLDILALLNEVNEEYNGKLIEKDLEKYVNKLVNNAIIINYYESGVLAGFIAFYANDYKKKRGFLSIICVKNFFRNNGIGKNLLTISINYLYKLNFKLYELEVLKSNKPAIDIYTRMGFKLVKEYDGKYLMRLTL